jgi:hypothetical protein
VLSVGGTIAPAAHHHDRRRTMPENVAGARELDRRLNACTDPGEMKALISRRRLVRAGMDFDRAMEAFERDNPLPPLRESFPFRLG